MEILTLDLDEIDYSLIGIHSNQEDYKIAFLLNKHLDFRFQRFEKCLDFENSNAEFPLFEFKDKNNYINYYLINNKHVQQIKAEKQGLFKESLSSTAYLIPEKKNVDFFLKIEGMCGTATLLNLVAKIKKAPKIITCYLVEPETLKSKNHLIF
jgi:hypothetical protein